MADLVKLHDDTRPEERAKVLDALNNNGLIVCPTDTVYSLRPNSSPKGFDRLAKAKVKPEKLISHCFVQT